MAFAIIVLELLLIIPLLLVLRHVMRLNTGLVTTGCLTIKFTLRSSATIASVIDTSSFERT